MVVGFKVTSGTSLSHPATEWAVLQCVVPLSKANWNFPLQPCDVSRPQLAVKLKLQHSGLLLSQPAVKLKTWEYDLDLAKPTVKSKSGRQ